MAFWAYQAKSVPLSAIPPIDIGRDDALLARHRPLMVWIDWSNSMSEPLYFRSSTHSIVIDTSQSITLYVPIDTSLNRSPMYWRANVAQTDPFDWKLPTLPVQPERVVVTAPSNSPDLLTPYEKLVALLAGIVTVSLSIVNTYLAWQEHRRRKMQEILLELQIATLQLELAEARARAEKMRNEAAKSGIILLS